MTSLETHNILDTALGLQFNECSIIAADACKYAQEVIGRPANTVDVICPPEHSGDTDVLQVKMSAVYIGNGMRGDESIAYYVERADTASPVRLIGVLADGIALPLATFQRRIGTTCDFVQLGSEIDSDTIIATEEDSPRSAYVGAISMLLQGKASPEHTETLAGLFDEEAKRRSEQMCNLYVASVWKMLVQTSSVYSTDEEFGKVRFVPRYSDSSTMTDPTVWRLYDPAGNNTGTSSLCLLARSGDEGCYFGSLSREHVVIPLLFLNQKGVYAEDESGQYQMLPEYDIEMLRNLVLRQKLATVQHKSNDMMQRKICEEFTEDDLCRFMEDVDIYRDHRRLKGNDRAISYVKYESAMDEAANNLDDVRQELRAMLCVDEVESALLGASSEKILFVAKQLGKVLTGSAEVLMGHGVITDRMIGTTATSADVQLEIIAGPDDTCKVTVRGRPAAFEGVPHETLHQNTIAFYRSMLASEEVTIDVLHDLLQKVALSDPLQAVEVQEEAPNQKRRWFSGFRKATA